MEQIILYSFPMRFKLWGKILVIFVVSGVLAIANLPADQKEFVRSVPLVGDYLANQKVHLGLDLQGGTHLDYKVITRGIAERDVDAVVKGVREVIERRVNVLGVAEPNIFESQVADERHIIVELAGIKDVEEAKAIVGKTIQLEFKEQKTEVDPVEAQKMTAQAREFLRAVRSEPAQFEEIFADYEDKPKATLAKDEEWAWASDLVGDFASVGQRLKAGEVWAELIKPQGTEYFVDSTGQAKQKEGWYAVQLLEKEENVERTIEHEEERKASHILIAFAGAERADASITRTEEEAQQRAEEALALIQASPADFSQLVQEYSDEPGAGERAGDLGFFRRGAMAPAFEDAVFEGEELGLVEHVVRTQFGYHVIRLDELKEAKTETQKEDRVKLAKVFFSTAPDGWAATGLTGQHFRHADVGSDPTTLRPIVNIYFTQAAISEQASVDWWQLVWYLIALTSGIAVFAYGIGIVMLDDSKVALRRDKLITIFAIIVLAGSIYGITQTSLPIDPDSEDSTVEPVAEDVKIAETDKTGVDIFAEITRRNLHKPIAIFLDGLSIIDTNGDGQINEADPAYAPTVQSEITNGQAVISGLRSYEEANALARNLNTGAIPAPVKLVGQFNIGATLGEQALTASLRAGFLGLAAVIAFMILYYRILGVLASLALVIYGLMLVFVIQIFPGGGIVLTLAGVAGIILSIGMAVDANILIFERLKEELRLGKSLGTAIEDGFDRAWTSIRDSNVSTLITCAILFWFGSSIIQGFALTLALGVLISMFTAITVTRSFLRAMVGTLLGRSGWLLGVRGAKLGDTATHSNNRFN